MLNFLVALLLITFGRHVLAQSSNDYEKLIKAAILNSNYSSTDRPVNPTSISVKLLMKQIVSVNQASLIVTTSSYLFLNWTDQRLVWDPIQYGGLSGILIQLKKIWYPNLYVINTADSNGYISISDSTLAIISFYGKVTCNLGLIGDFKIILKCIAFL